MTSGTVILHLHLTPHTPQSAIAGTWYVPVECSVDANRQLTCQVMVGTGTDFTSAAAAAWRRRLSHGGHRGRSGANP